ncbi:hypothetical protein LEMLEM_LOCUS10623, partial [Lemmus lemmus]
MYEGSVGDLSTPTGSRTIPSSPHVTMTMEDRRFSLL